MEAKEMIKSSHTQSNKMKYLVLGLNVLLFISFFLPWIKTTSELAMGMEYFNLSSVDGYIRLSPYKLISVVNKLSSYMGGGSGEYQRIYVFLIIPIAAILNVIAYFIKKEKSKIIQIISSVLVLFLVIYVYSKVSSIDDIGYFIKANVGFYLALLCSVGVIVSQFIKLGGSVKTKTIEVANEVVNNVEAVNFDESSQDNIKSAVVDEDKVKVSEATTNDESAFKKNTDQFVNFIKDDFSNKDKLHKSLVVFGGIAVLAMILSIVFNTKFDESVIASVVSSVVLLGIFAYSYFKIDFKLSERRNKQVLGLSDVLYGLTDFMKSIDNNILMAVVGLILVKFFTGYMIKSYDFVRSMYVINLVLNTAIVMGFLRILALKDFKALRNVFVAIGIMYFVMILRIDSFGYNWIDFKAAYMLWMAWVGFLFVETNYKWDK